MRMQNTSHAVMAQRAELKNSLDDFPTPPWATRALIEHVVVSKNSLASMSCLEPACGRGHMSVALAHYFREVASFDVFDTNLPQLQLHQIVIAPAAAVNAVKPSERTKRNFNTLPYAQPRRPRQDIGTTEMTMTGRRGL
jgi:predicted RNA methylase